MAGHVDAWVTVFDIHGVSNVASLGLTLFLTLLGAGLLVAAFLTV